MQKKEAIQKYLERFGGDGHSIITSSSLVEMGFDPEFVAKYTRDHESGESCKDIIFDINSGNPFRSCHGVYTLEFSYAIAKDLEADITEARSKMGRGFQAQSLVLAINEIIKNSA